MKSNHNKYAKISLRYVQVGNFVTKTDIWLSNYFGEGSYSWKDDCSLHLLLSFNDKPVYFFCDINVLLDMYRKPGKYYPFTCSKCAESGCAGIFAPCRVIHNSGDIILCLRRPLSGSWNSPFKYRAFRVHKQDFLTVLVNVIHFRISLENKLNIKFDVQDEKTARYNGKLLAEFFGFSDTPEYQYRISQNISKAYLTLKDEFMELMGN